MNKRKFVFIFCAAVLICSALNLAAQSLIDIDFGVGSQSAKKGFAATGQTTNDVWNLFRFYDPKYVPGTPLVFTGEMAGLKLADGTASPVSVSVTNAPGVWGNASGDPMYDSYIFAQNGSNILVTISHLEPGRYNFYCYGHADPDASGEQNSIFRLQTGTTNLGPLTAASSAGWKASNPWQEGSQYVVFRDVEVQRDMPVVLEVAPGPNGIAVLNGMQISSRGTSPPRNVAAVPVPVSTTPTNLFIREIRYEGTVNDNEARFNADLEMESLSTNEISATLFQGNVAVNVKSIPDGVRIVRIGNEYRLVVKGPGIYKPKLEVVARIARVEPWNQLEFTGPPAAIASLSAAAENQGIELQMLSGTPLEGEKAKSHVSGFLGADRKVALRWQSKGTEVARKALITARTDTTIRFSPTVAKLTTELHYEILQAAVPRLAIALPTNQALTRLQGEQIRDWKVDSSGSNQVLSIEFIRPVEKSYSLILFSEQTLNTSETQVIPAQPLASERESGLLQVFAEDAVVEMGATVGLRQTSVTNGALAAYRFYGRPVQLTAKVKRVEPEVNVADCVRARLEETRLVVTHSLALNVEKAGIYSLELTPQPGLVVADVKGDGIEDWKVNGGKVKVSFSSRILGARLMEVHLEQALKELPPQFTVSALRVTGASRENAQIGASAAPGLRLKTVEMTGLSEVPVGQLPAGSDELLGFNSNEPEWRVVLAAERLPARVVAEVFNLITVGDGLVGGSATVRYGLINQGVQQFRLKLPAHWKNVEFTGPNIRGKEQQGDTWTINLQDKAWGGYTLVVTYDYQFDPAKATLDAGGLHALDAEHETGSVAVTTAASLKLQPGDVVEPLRQIDPTELAATDRALITRPVLLAYRYAGSRYALQLHVTRHEEVAGLDAVADRTQLTSVLTDGGEMLTQASFMVKNNDKQFQRFQLPADARFWGCYVNGQPSKAERDGDWLLVSLPRGENRDEAFSIDLVYAQKTEALKATLFPKSLHFQAPKTDVPNTFAEWELFVPATQRLSGFGGTMAVARGTTYTLHDAITRFCDFYSSLFQAYGSGIAVFVVLALIVTGLLIGARRQGATGIITVLVTLCIIGILASMLLPSLANAKSKAQRIGAVNNLKQIGTAIRIFAGDNGSKFPNTLDQIDKELGGQKRLLIDPESGQPFVYIGGGLNDQSPGAIVAYSPVDRHGRVVLLADGSVQQMNSERFAEAMQNSERAKSGELSETISAGLMGTPMALEGANKEKSDVAGKPMKKSPLPGMARNLGGSGAPMAERERVAISAREPAAPTAVGVRSIRIDIPRKGQPFNFTKVLNTSQEPLSISMSVMSASTFSAARSTLQVATFLLGLILFWLNWRSGKAFRSALGLALAIGAVVALFISVRALHLVLIVGVPILVIAITGVVIYKLWPAKVTRPAAQGDVPPAEPPVAVSLAFFLLLAQGVQAEVKSPDVAPPTLTSASYTGAIHEQAAQFSGELQLTSTVTNQSVVLFGEDVAVQDFTVKSGAAKVLRQDGRVSVLLPVPGTVELSVKFLVKLGGDVSKRQLAFQLPSALSSHLSATIDESEADVEFPTAVAFKRTAAGQQTRIDATIGSDDRVEMAWTPRVKRAAEIAATVFAENRSLVTVGGGVVDIHAVLDFQITQGELRQARVRLPSGHRLLRVEGESLRTWELKEEGSEAVLIIELLKGVSPAWRVTLETERPLEELPSALAVDVPHALDVQRESGWVAVRAGEEVGLSIEAAQNLQRTDTGDFTTNGKDKPADLFSAYRFFQPDFRLTIKAESVRPEIEATVRNQVKIASEQISLVGQLTYTIKKAGIFDLKVSLPTGFRLQSVTGENIQQFSTNEINGEQILELTFKNRVMGTYAVQLSLVSLFKEAPKTVTIPGIHPLDIQKITGFVLVSSEPGIALKTLTLEGAVEIPPSVLGTDSANAVSGGTVLAYKYMSSQPGTKPEWKLEVATEVVESWVRAEIADILDVSESVVTGQALVRYDIQNAPIREFRLRVPTNYHNVEIIGPNIRRRDQVGNEWRVELQNKVNGKLALTVTWEQEIDFSTNAMEVAGIQALGVERETGVVVVKARPPLQVLEKTSSGELVKIDVREVPDWAGAAADSIRSGGPAVLAYRYVRPGFKLALEARRFQDAAVLQAMVDQVQFATVVANDGQVMTEMKLSVRNNGLQHLEIELPSRANLWSAFVGGQPVRPARRDGKLLLPLETSTGSDGAPVTVELTYVGTEKFPQIRGKLNLVSPKFDVPLKNARWDLYLPPDYDYEHFEGTMSHAVESAPVVRLYSLSEYRVQEAEKQANRRAEAMSAISNAQRSLAAGDAANLRSAWGQLNNGYVADEQTKQEVSELRKNLGKMQGHNLIQAQEAYSGGLGGGGRRDAGAANGSMHYDADVAEQQWTKLQQAQELAVAKIQPLRINLPTRGLHQAFTQVLQTEVQKPLTLSFVAVNTQKTSWVKELLGAGVVFAGLWIAMVGALRSMRARKESRA